jgi:hypothetical protein
MRGEMRIVEKKLVGKHENRRFCGRKSVEEMNLVLGLRGSPG